ncbi:MAG TPA: hypothetical protein VJ970_02570, partial [Flavobacteriaceae bacterium]|nr:hypothetical protein [Flavobacteriaceae bacterium]
MKPFSLLLSIVLVFTTLGCIETKEKEKINTLPKIAQPNNSTIIGVWKHMSAQGPIKIHFKENGIIETDIGDDNTIDVVSNYSIKSDTIEFFDKEGKSCPNKGIYKIYNRGYTVSFDVIDDLCNGRIKATSGFWVRSNHQEQ